MMKKKNKISENYLEKKPVKADLKWSCDDNGIVTLEIENTGIFNRIAQKLLKKPKISYIHLDEIGSLVWPLIDGEKNLIELAGEVEKKFGEKAHPLYERIAEYFRILESYNFISWNTDNQNKK